METMNMDHEDRYRELQKVTAGEAKKMIDTLYPTDTLGYTSRMVQSTRTLLAGSNH